MSPSPWPASPTSSWAARITSVASASAPLDRRRRHDPDHPMSPGGGATPLLDRRLVFVTGKGGVGKTAMAAALGLLGARQGRRVLVCEVDAKGNLADFLETPPTRFRPHEVKLAGARRTMGHLHVMAMDTEESL